MTPSRCALDRQSGLTLLELLVALLVLGLLVVGLTQGVRAGLSMWSAQSRRLGETAELDAGARVLRMLLSGISAPPMKLEASSDRLAFVGDLPTLELVQGRLVLRWTPHLHERTTAPEPEPIETELIRDIERLEFAYWGAPSPDQPAEWQNQASSSPLPELIRVRLAFAKGDRRRWPDLIVAPAISASPQTPRARSR